MRQQDYQTKEMHFDVKDDVLLEHKDALRQHQQTFQQASSGRVEAWQLWVPPKHQQPMENIEQTHKSSITRAKRQLQILKCSN